MQLTRYKILKVEQASLIFNSRQNTEEGITTNWNHVFNCLFYTIFGRYMTSEQWDISWWTEIWSYKIVKQSCFFEICFWILWYYLFLLMSNLPLRQIIKLQLLHWISHQFNHSPALFRLANFVTTHVIQEFVF